MQIRDRNENSYSILYPNRTVKEATIMESIDEYRVRISQFNNEELLKEQNILKAERAELNDRPLYSESDINRVETALDVIRQKLSIIRAYSTL